jgi:hypothetical protein
LKKEKRLPLRSFSPLTFHPILKKPSFVSNNGPQAIFTTKTFTKVVSSTDTVDEDASATHH